MKYTLVAVVVAASLFSVARSHSFQAEKTLEERVELLEKKLAEEQTQREELTQRLDGILSWVHSLDKASEILDVSASTARKNALNLNAHGSTPKTKAQR